MDLLTDTWVPTWVMVLVVALLSVSLLAGVPLARAAGKRRGRRLAHPELFGTGRERAKDTALFLAALIPSVLVWLAVMSVSFIGLTGFARQVMAWDHWTNILVPLSLDGISISFGAWAFVAVKRGRHPGRAYKIVLASASMSAALNFVHGRGEWSIWAGFYLAFLSLAGMAMFHELLDQFMAAYDEDELLLRARVPRFGQRWLYAPVSTFAARRAWIVHPPAEQLRPSVRNALGHLEDTRQARRQRRLDAALRVREEQQAKLVEVHARNEVRAARRGQYAGRGAEQAPASPEPASGAGEPAGGAAGPSRPGGEAWVPSARTPREIPHERAGVMSDGQPAGQGQPVWLEQAREMLPGRPEPSRPDRVPLLPVDGSAAVAPRQREAQRPVVAPVSGLPAAGTWKALVYAHLGERVRLGDALTQKAVGELARQVPGISASSADRYARMWRQDVEAGVVQLSRPPLRTVRDTDQPS